MTHWWRIVREPSVALTTMGAFYINGAWFCWTVEDEIREIKGQPVMSWKVQKETAIPASYYPVKLTMSGRFGRLLPEVLNVPGFSGIRIHRGNFNTDTEGCPIVGFGRGKNMIAGGTSKPAEEALVAHLKQVEAAGDNVWIAVENPPVF